MNADDPAAQRYWRRCALWLALAIIVYGTGYLMWHLATPLGRAPQLDGREYLELARQISDGTLPHEPFYRAMLYPAILAVPLKLGLPFAKLPAFAATFGLICHFIITVIIGRAAWRMWPGPQAWPAGLAAAALWGFFPVGLFYAVDVGDAIPALVFCALGVYTWSTAGTSGWLAFLGGIFFALAVAMRPHYLTIALVAPLARAWLTNRWRPQWRDYLGWLGAAVPLLIVGCVQLYWSGQFRIMPVQGAYNFYAANRPGANGRYYTQQGLIPNLAPGENPARKESEILYAQAQKDTPISAPSEVYWLNRTWQVIEDNPMAWLKLMGKKLYYLFNNFDQYNNLSYAWRQAESPWLRWNFLGWGALLVMASGVIPLAWRRAADPRALPGRAKLAGLALVFAVYAGGLLLFFVSGRFRLPLAPLLCAVSAGWVVLPKVMPIRRGEIIWSGVVMTAAALLTFSDFFGAHDTSTFVQDEMLAANAASELGDDAHAYTHAQRALALAPERPDARSLAVLSYFNLAVAGEAGDDSEGGWRAQLPRLTGMEMHDAAMNLAAGTAHWKLGDRALAEKIWADGAAKFGADSAPAKALAAAKSLDGANVSPPPDPALVDFLRRPAVSDATPLRLPSAPSTN